MLLLKQPLTAMYVEKLLHMNKKTLIVVVGPTAIGKTAMGIQLANHFKTEIISADSRQFFKEMAIGTAVPNSEELSAAKHHCIQHISIQQKYSVGDFEKEALSIAETIFNKNDFAIMVGGSGLYVDAVCNGLDVFPEVLPEVKTEVGLVFETKGLEALTAILKEKDPKYYDKVTLQNPQRVMRAVEVCLSSGKPFSSFLNKNKGKRPFNIIKIGLNADRQVIYDRINKRVDIMMENGLLAEAKKVYAQKHLNALNTVGYKELFKYMDGEWDLDFAVSEIKKNTRRFAKRQLTWYRKDEAVKWFDFESVLTDVISYVNSIQASKAGK